MESPPANDLLPPKERRRRSGCFYAAVGAGTGGCLVPFVLLLFCGFVFHDVGGPLFWPLISVPLGFIGLAVGLWAHAEFGPNNP